MTATARALPPLPGPYSVEEAADRLLAVAASQIGYREGRSGGGDWNNDNAYGAWYGSNRVSWCAQFVSWCADRAGYLDTVIPRHQYTPNGWNWFKTHDRDVKTPKRGDILYVYGYVAPEQRTRVHHVGIVEKVLPGGRIQTVEGNTNTGGSSQGNGVYRLTRTVSPRLYFARPDYEKVLKPRPKPAGLVASQPSKPVLDLSEVVYAATHANLQPGSEARIAQIRATLQALGCGDAKKDGFKQMWAAWQRKLGYRSADADGVPGPSSARRLAAYGYTYRP